MPWLCALMAMFTLWEAAAVVTEVTSSGEFGQLMRRERPARVADVDESESTAAEIQCEDTFQVNASNNIALNKDPTVTSSCRDKKNKRGKGFLTDGDTRQDSDIDRKYWISCSDDSSPAATVSFATTCVREVKIWSRPNCCPTESEGLKAKVWDGDNWQNCGGTSTNFGTQSSFTFSCGIKGSKVKIMRPEAGATGRVSLSEILIYPGVQPPACLANDIANTNLAKNVAPSVSSDCSPKSSTESSKAWLTDGSMPADKKAYWRSCAEMNPSATVAIDQTCVREVKIWARNCCGGQPAGVIAEVMVEGGDWKQCGETAPALSKGASHSFTCAWVGSKVRVRRSCQSGCKIGLRELKIFSVAT